MKRRVAAFRPTEKSVQESILDLLQFCANRGLLYFWRSNSGVARYKNKDGTERIVRYGVKGLPDICGFMNDGKGLYIEVKRPGGRIRPEQVGFIQNAASAGCVAMFASDANQVQLELKKNGYL